MLLPDFTPDGVLPYCDPPYASSPADIAARLTFTGVREDLWLSFLSLRQLVNLVVWNANPNMVTEWWLHGRFVTNAVDVDQLDAILVLEPTDADFPPLEVLIRVLKTRGVRDALKVDTQVFQYDDLVDARRRCGRNSPVDGGEFIDAGWVMLL